MNLRVAAALGLLVTTTACDDLTFGSSVGGVRESAPAVAGSVKAVGLVLQRSAPGGGRLVEAQLLLVDPGAPDRTVPVGDLKLLIGGESLTLQALIGGVLVVIAMLVIVIKGEESVESTHGN